MLRSFAFATTLLVTAPALAQTAPAPAIAPTAAPVTAGTPPSPAPGATDLADPWERTNRSLFAVHKGLDRAVVGPVARGYKAVTPRPVRQGVRNFVNNLGEPVTFINDVLQGQVTRGGQTATRFVLNTTVGVLGVFDVATAAGVPYHYEDFGQTLATYGVGSGPYLFVPILGPSTVRDAGGRVADIVVNPVNYVEFEADSVIRRSLPVANAVDARANYDDQVRELERSATDEYVTYRSLYAQNRRAQIANGAATAVEDLPEFEATPAEPRPATPRRRRR